MAFDLSSITDGAGMRPPRILLLGVEKIGKSTFAAGAPSPCFLPIAGEEGIDGLKVKQFPKNELFSDTMSALQVLLNGGHDHETVVIDSVSTLEALIWNQVCFRCDGASSIETVYGGYGKGYGEALKEWQQVVNYLDSLRTHLNMVTILIGHVKVKTFINPEGPDYNHYVADINDRAANLLYRWADAIVFCNTKVAVKVEKAGFGKEVGKGIDTSFGQRFMYTQKRPSHPGGGRGVYGQLPYELPLSWEHYQAAIQAAS